jgi:hypothetical protein
LLSPIRGASALTFSNTFDSSWTNSTLLTEATLAATAAETELSALFSNSVSISISFDATTATGLADANFNSSNFPTPFGNSNFAYSQIKSDLTNHSLAHPENTALASTVANLPASVSCPGCNSQPAHFLLPDAESLALTGSHIPGGSGYAFQGFIRINPTFNYDADPNNTILPNQIDLAAVMLHEITHVMGRDDYSFCGGPGNCGGSLGSDPWLTPLDLDRFNCGSTTRNTVATDACFSINGGSTDLRQFSATSDTGDWDSQILSANNAFAEFGVHAGLLPSDILEMNALGWDPTTMSSVPEPASLALLCSGFVWLLAFRRCKVA